MGETIQNSAETIDTRDVTARIAALEKTNDASAELVSLRDMREQYLAQGVEQAWELGATLLRESLLEGANREMLRGRYRSLQFDGVAYLFLSYEATGIKPDKTLSTSERIKKTGSSGLSVGENGMSIKRRRLFS